MIELDYGDRCPDSLFPMFGRQVCGARVDGYRLACDLAEGHESWHAALDTNGHVTTSWNPSRLV